MEDVKGMLTASRLTEVTTENGSKHGNIWAVGGGKGGTGKSFLTGSMATCLALKGKPTILVDIDLGGANLHNFLGMVKPKRTLTDFFESKVPLRDVVMRTGISNLQLITGSIGSLEPESITFAQKQKLFRHIKSLDAETILIDLGAGAHFNTIDSFLFADKMIVVTVPEITAIENMYQFIKSVYYRKLNNIFKTYKLKTIVQDTWENRSAHNIHSLKDLVAHLRQGADSINHIFEQEMSDFVVHLILNEVRTPRDILIGANLKQICLNVLGLKVLYSGYTSYDEAVQKNINKRESFIVSNRLSPVVREIGDITENIETGTAFSIPRELYNARSE